MIVAPKPPTLAERLRAIVLTYCPDDAPLTCAFVPGGKLHGVGIPSELYCDTCGHARVWHDVAEGAVTVEAAQEIIRLSGQSRGGSQV